MVLSVYGEQRNSQGMYCIIVWRKKKELHFILWDILKLDVGIYTQYICLPETMVGMMLASIPLSVHTVQYTVHCRDVD